jgi:hypothetical protein
MRAPRALLVVLIAALLTAGTVLVAAPSSAGGPTSVLLVNPATGRAAALYTTDPRYTRLSSLLDASYGPPAAGERPPGTGPGSLVDSGGINVTWLIHDVQVWRVDRVYLDAKTAMIATQSDFSGRSVFDAEPVWHRASNPQEVAALLKELGLGADRAPASAAPYPPDAAAPAAFEQTPTPPAASTTGSGSSGLWWALAGAVAGAVLVLGLNRLRSTRRREPDEALDADLPASADVITSDR